MRGFAVLAAVFAAVVMLTPGPARAYRATPLTAGIGLVASNGVADRWERDRRYQPGRGWDRGRRYEDRRWRGRDRRWRGRERWRTRCHTQWRSGRRERVCRRFRY